MDASAAEVVIESPAASEFMIESPAAAAEPTLHVQKIKKKKVK